MGQLLSNYIATTLPALKSIVADQQQPQPALPPGQIGTVPTQPQPAMPPPGAAGIQQPEGARTFPMAEPEPIMGQHLSPQGEALYPMATMAARGSPTFPETQAPKGQPTMPPPTGDVPEQPDRSIEFEKGEDSFMGMAEKADDEQINKSIDVLDDQLQAQGSNIDQKYDEVTKSQPGVADKQGLTRKEKGLILMEFGLNLMAASGTGTGTAAGDIGQAGAAAFKGHMGRRQAQREAEIEREEREQKRRLTEAQIAKMERPDMELGEQGGMQVLINKQTGEATPVLMDGQPVPAGQRDKLEFEIKKEAFMSAYGDQIKDPAELERRAVAFANSVRQVAFPELARADAAKSIIRELNKAENASQKFLIGDKEVRWKNMSYDEKTRVATEMVDMAMKAVQGGVTSSDGAGANFGLSDDQVAGMEPNTKYKLTNGKWVSKRNGKLVEVEPPKAD